MHNEAARRGIPRPGTVNQHPHSLKLVVARGDHRFDLYLAALIISLLVDLQMDKACQKVEQVSRRKASSQRYAVQ